MNIFKKIALFVVFLIIPACMAIDVTVKAPSEVKEGETFNLEVYAKNVSNCGGLECNIYVPDNFIIEDVISYDVGADYNLTINRNNSATIQYVFLTHPKNENFKVGIFKIKALKAGNTSIILKAKASDSNGNSISIPEKVITINVIPNSTINTPEKSENFSINSVLAIFAIIVIVIAAVYIIKRR